MLILTRPPLNIRSRLERLLPAQPCLLCGAMDHGAWCADCDADLPGLGATQCPYCAVPTPDNLPCGRCLKKRPMFDRTVAAFAYDFPVDKLVQSLKFNEQLQLADAFAQQLAAHIGTPADCIVPMPLHPARLRQRGHNQSQELARHLARRLNLPLLPHACQRVRNTPPQASLGWKERVKNLRRAFACGEDFSGKHVAMVDDVMTSGASLNELALALRRAGAREVSAWVVARALPQR
jgi:ComF family protein